MAVFGRRAAAVYGYSNARVKALESKLISRNMMQEILSASDPAGTLNALLQTDYRKNLEEYGGLKAKGEQIDFALSRNLASSVSKLIAITPPDQRSLIRAVVGKWDLYNVKLAIDAKAKSLPFESISRYVIDYGIYNSQVLKDALREGSVDSVIERLSINSPYKRILSEALAVLRKTGNTLEAEAVMDRIYYNNLGSVITKLTNINFDSARVLRMEIDMKNLLLLIRAKKYNMDFALLSPNIINNGTLGAAKLHELYTGSKDIESLVKNITLFNLSKQLEAYLTGESRQLLIFEVGMRNSIFNKSMTLLRHSVLSFGAILAYSYLKEIEVFTLRIAINGKAYGLSKEELYGMIVWRAE